MFELERRFRLGDSAAKDSIVRQKSTNDIRLLQNLVTSILLVSIGFIAVLNFGWLVGVSATLFVIFVWGPVTRIGLIKKISNKLYKRIEKSILEFIKKYYRSVSLLRGLPITNSHDNYHIGSRQELQHLIIESGAILTPDEKKLVASSLSFNKLTVGEIMTPRNMISSIDKSEFLGPLALNDLHKIGHSRLPVINGDIDHIVGILNINNLFALNIKLSTTADKAMDKKVFYIREDQILPNALAVFLQTRSDILVVINKQRETVGLLLLVDIFKNLMGHNVTDKFEDYDNIEAVSRHQPLN